MIIDKMIENVKQRQKEENREERQKQYELNSRRKDAVRKIAEAGMKYFDLGNDFEAEKLVERRMLEAEKGRLSRAEALADLAESGDFESDPWWWNIVEESEGNRISLWKGYVKYQRFVRRQYESTDDFVDLCVREKVSGGYVAEVLGNYGVSAAVSENNPREAATKAYNAYQSKLTGNVASLLPPELDFREDILCTSKNGGEVIPFDNSCKNEVG